MNFRITSNSDMVEVIFLGNEMKFKMIEIGYLISGNGQILSLVKKWGEDAVPIMID